MATHSSILAWEIPRIEEPSGLWWSMRSQRVPHDLATKQQQSRLKPEVSKQGAAQYCYTPFPCCKYSHESPKRRRPTFITQKAGSLQKSKYAVFPRGPQAEGQVRAEAFKSGRAQGQKSTGFRAMEEVLISSGGRNLSVPLVCDRWFHSGVFPVVQ